MPDPVRSIAIYSRKSRFTGKGESIENQVELCRQYIRAHHGEKAAQEALVYEDEGFSGGNLQRPRFQAMLAHARDGGLSSVICYRLDRISRNIGDFAGLIDELGSLEVSFVSIREQFDTSSPMGRAMMYIASVFSQLERETIAERIRDNMHELAKTGRWLGGVTPTGYRSQSAEQVSVDGRTRRACHLALIPEEAELVELIYDLFLETCSLTGTEAALIRRGRTTKNGRLFSRFSIKAILSNPVYLIADEDALRYFTCRGVELCSPISAFDGECGIMAYNRTAQQAGSSARERPMEDWIIAVGKHPGIIPAHRWIQVQQLLERNRSASYRKPRGHTALLSGLLVCGACGSPMRPKLASRPNADGSRAYYYRCALKERSKGHACKSSNAPGEMLDAAALDALSRLSFSPEAFLRGLAEWGHAPSGSDDNTRLRTSLEGARREIRGLLSALGRAADTPAERYILDEIDRLHRNCEDLEKQLRQPEREAASPPLSTKAFTAALRSLSSPGSLLGTLDIEPRRMAVRELAARIVWTGSAARLYLHGAPLPEPGTAEGTPQKTTPTP